ncbi:hypothetical protein P280DRAFT_489958 [Massarina eburnea CBS 473.64]|uniref:Nucleoporin NUP37 n=1 Tax=Massarina eburnea CBS 473.64 TaxID=1395130 RepID=A0A6A6S642_9PLEO|nr:hypothetical protein P280DRAFT_489958 [Massarina eburnea CBS 473.64]
MKPFIATKGKTTQLRYELPQRVHATKIYPVKAPNGSTIILYGQDGGVGILWRGGRPLRESASPPKELSKVNGTSKTNAISLDSDDEEPAAKAEPSPKAEFDDEEEELDPDHPYPSIIQHIRLPLNTDVLHIAVPSVASAAELLPAGPTPPIFHKKICFAIACTDYSVRVITLPLAPPPEAAKTRSAQGASLFGEDITTIPVYAGHQDIPRGVSVTWTSRNEPKDKQFSDDEMDVDREEAGEGAAAVSRRSPRKKQARSRSRSRSRSGVGGDASGFDLLVASHTDELGGLLYIWRFNLTETSVKMESPVSPYYSLTLQKPATKVVFNTARYPKTRHSQLLITDKSGTARIFDPFAARTNGAGAKLGAFVASFKTGFEHTKANAPPVLATRKAIIDAAWASDGHHVVALLADGEWGVWDVDRSGPNPPAVPSAFSLRGFLGTVDSDREKGGPPSPKARGGRGSLAPMTPNTRRKKEEALFSSPSSSTPTRGGISVASLAATRDEPVKDSVVIWYGTEVHRIADLAKFWARNVAGSSGTSLPGPGLSQLQDVSVLGESITSIDQFDTTVQNARMAIPRDIVVSGEHRLIIAANSAQQVARDPTALFTRERVEEEELRRTDQALLSRGELDLGGMDRMLGSMEASGSQSLVLGNPRKVLFASSAS